MGVEYATVGPIDPRGLSSSKSQKSRIMKKVYHPYFEDDIDTFDYMLLQLEDPIQPNSPVKLTINDDESVPSVGEDLTIMGFGLMKENTWGWPDVLQKGKVQAVDFDECNKTYAEDNLEEETLLCAGVPDGSQDTCQGDSGGPLVLEKSSNSHVLVGLVSWGKGCGRPGIPGIFARTSAALEWIQNVVCSCWDMSWAELCDGFDEGVSQQQ
eukprot:scaffold13563_cov122-Cylindrotheca_fusiformis.AAC.1